MKKTVCKLLLSTALASVILSTSGCSSPEQKKQEAYQKALEYIENNKSEAAIIELKNAIQIDPKFAEAHYQLGKLYLETGIPAKAYEEYVRAADLNPKNIDANLKAAQFYLLAQDKESSRKRINQVLKVDPKNEEALILLANIELRDGKSYAAIKIVNSFGEETEKSPRLLNLLGRIYATEKKWQKAEESFKKALALDKENLTHYMMLLRFYEERQDKGSVEKLLKNMATLFPEEPQVYILTARYFETTQQFDKVEPLLRKVIALSPDSALPMLQLITYKEQRGKIVEALAVAKEAQAKFPEDKNINICIASLLFDQQQFEESKKILDSVLAKDANLPTAQILAGRFLSHEQKYQQASENFQKIIEEYPKWSKPYYYLGLNQFFNGAIEQSETALAKALELDKSEAKYFAFMAKIQLAKRNFVETRNNAMTALRLNPQNIRAAILLGKALIGLNEYKQAVSILTQLEELLPDDITILESLAIATLGSKNKKDGEKYLDKLLALDPAHSRGLALYLGLKFPRDIKGATSFMRNQLKKAPKDVRILFMLSNMLRSQGEMKEALQYLDIARQQEPDNAQIYLATARVHIADGKLEKALEQYKKALKQQPRYIPALTGVAGILEARGEIEEAEKYYNKVLEIAPEHALAANNLAWIIAEQEAGDLGRALQLSMIAKQASPDNIQIIDTLGWVHFKRKAYSLAISQFQLALEKSPGDPTVLYHLALAYDANKQRKLAQKTLEQIDMQKDFPDKKQVQELIEKLKH